MGSGSPRLYCSRVSCVDEGLRPLGEAGLSDDTRFERQLFDCTGYGNTMVMDPTARDIVISRLPATGAVMHDWWCGLVLSALGRFFHDPWSGVLYRQHGRNIFGANPRRGAEIVGHLRDLLRNRRRFYPIHAQAAALARLHGDRLSPPSAGWWRGWSIPAARWGPVWPTPPSGRSTISAWSGRSPRGPHRAGLVLTVAAPRVAVLLSTYNGEAFVAAQLDSLLAQEGVEVEVFARDDGSTDATVAILARYAEHWPTLAAPMGGGNLGPAASFLELLARAPEGFDFYAFCDQDDVWLPTKLARAAERLGDVAGPALYCSAVMCVDATLRPLGERRIGGDPSFEHLLFENVAFGNTVVMNAAARALIIARPPAAGVVMHDWWCALVMSAFGVVLQDRFAGVLYRQHRENAVGSSPSGLREFAGRLIDLLGNPSRFYRIHAQASEFQRLWGPTLPDGRLRPLAALVETRRTGLQRLRFATRGRVICGRWMDTVAVRALIALGLY